MSLPAHGNGDNLTNTNFQNFRKPKKVHVVRMFMTMMGVHWKPNDCQSCPVIAKLTTFTLSEVSKAEPRTGSTLTFEFVFCYKNVYRSEYGTVNTHIQCTPTYKKCALYVGIYGNLRRYLPDFCAEMLGQGAASTHVAQGAEVAAFQQCSLQVHHPASNPGSTSLKAFLTQTLFSIATI